MNEKVGRNLEIFLTIVPPIIMGYVSTLFGEVSWGVLGLTIAATVFGMIEAVVVIANSDIKRRAKVLQENLQTQRWFERALLDAYCLADGAGANQCPTCRQVAQGIEQFLASHEDQATIDALVNLKRQVVPENALSPEEWATVRNVLGIVHNLIQRRDEKDIAGSWRSFCTWQKGLEGKIAPILGKVSEARLPKHPIRVVPSEEREN